MRLQPDLTLEPTCVGQSAALDTASMFVGAHVAVFSRSKAFEGKLVVRREPGFSSRCPKSFRQCALSQSLGRSRQ